MNSSFGFVLLFVFYLGGMCIQQPVAAGGSGSTYVYGYIDANYRKDMTQEECVDFITNSELKK